MARPRFTKRTVGHCCSSPRNCCQCMRDHGRLIPVFFILVLLAYAYLILTFSVSISYTLLHRRHIFSALLQLVLTHFLVGGAAISLLIAVFRDPGSPKGTGTENLGGAEEGRAGASEGSVRRRTEAGERAGFRDAREERDDGDQAPLLSADAEAGYEEGEDISLHNRRGGSSSSGPKSNASHTAPLLTSGPSSLLPGQPRLPARTSRDQLADQLSLAQRLAPASTLAQPRIDTGDAFGASSTSDPQQARSTSFPTATRTAAPPSSRGPRRNRSGSTSKVSDLMIKSTGEARWCNKCSGPKPDRAHHCSTCGVCVLRMDHHCPWLGGCIGLRNHKAFFLFLTYTAAVCIYAFQETARAFIRWINDEKNGSETTPVTWAVLLLIAFIFGIALIPFSIYHSYLICKNKTTIESMEGGGRIRLPSERLHNGSGPRPSRVNVQDRLRQIVANPQLGFPPQPPSHLHDEDSAKRWRADEELTREERKALKKANKLNLYDIGWKRNWRMIMGRTWWEWFLPWGEPEADGFYWDINTRALEELDRVTMRIRTGEDPPAARRDEAGLNDFSDGEDDEDDAYPQRARRDHRDDDPAPDAAGLVRVEDSMTPSDQRRAAAHGRVPTLPGQGRDEGDRWESGHGEAEWGPAPRRDFVLYDVDSDEEAS
ncbi:hypothetical protein A4X13_0g4446 [Tilletia indica]|uniref:Palmitoyltransferase n=1 Tax=Tilletia indica TaxID=43049 RepID=A0A177T9K2_9BASI|nr:hypothetical protein A4X13_0g4446 [Tilletia indica]